jgi:toxin HigB-1
MYYVICSFRNRGTEDAFNGADTGSARRICQRSVWPIARRKLDQLNRARELRELGIPPGNRLERLHEDREGQHSIRINDPYRICFRWEGRGAYEVEISDYH